MSDIINIREWPEKIRQRYENYLKTSFFFKEPKLRDSFQNALQEEESLLKGPFDELDCGFENGIAARALAQEHFPEKSKDLLPALMDSPLYVHQEQAIRTIHSDHRNVVVATGTASGKTESFLYPIMFELYRQHLTGELGKPGVRAMILYPMNALANDQRERLGDICRALHEKSSEFRPTFGQYIGQTPENAGDNLRNAATRREERLTSELVFRDEMRRAPPHILLTNYSMLEYLLIRPDDSPLFDQGRSVCWQFIVLDEAHQYRGAKGMEMGMLIRRLKQRLRDGGQQGSFRCIATSATISSSEGDRDKQAVANFAKELFGEPFSVSDIIFGKSQLKSGQNPRRYHAFLRALEGAFLVHKDGEDVVVLNRKDESEDEMISKPLEIALCRECGQHYYVGQERKGKLEEAIRDPSQPDFGVDYYLPTEEGEHLLCRCCGALSTLALHCSCKAEIRVKKCESHKEHVDQLKQCEVCEYRRGGIGDPVQEIVHGSDGPNTVISTALHELLPEERRKVLAFADSRQEAAFFAWYVEDSYKKLRDRNLILRAIKAEEIDMEGLSIDDLRNRLLRQWEMAGLFSEADTKEQRNRQVLVSILREALTEERRLSLSGVGLVKWFVRIPNDLPFPKSMRQPPWNFTDDEARSLTGYLLDELRFHRAMSLPESAGAPGWNDISPWPQQAYGIGPSGKRKNVSQWGSPQSGIVKHFLHRLLMGSALPDSEKQSAATKLMENIWHKWRNCVNEPILVRGIENGTFRLNQRWVRVKLTEFNEIWECSTCATLSTYNIRNVCPRNRCPGTLSRASLERVKGNHYRKLYESTHLPSILNAEEHTAQIDSEEARQRQEKFKNSDIHLLSSSTTFEVGVDLGDLEVVFLRNIPPEPFNYTQRAGRSGRRETPGLALTYCRRNSHDLYHYEDPENRVIRGVIHPPRLKMMNEKIILRHVIAAVLSAFFRKHQTRFGTVENFIGDWSNPYAVSDLRKFCRSNRELSDMLSRIVPESMHNKIGLKDESWIDNISGPQSRFSSMEMEVCSDFVQLENMKQRLIEEQPPNWTAKIGQLERRMKTISKESTLNFLSRKAVIPKYGFPVDVVELDTHPQDGKLAGVALQRDLSQAIAEYAPGGKVVANKLEWESYGVKVVADKAWPVRHYQYDSARNFKQCNESDSSALHYTRKYLIPEFGFVTPMFEKPKEPRRRTRRLYTTRPFFHGFRTDTHSESVTILGVRVTKACPGTLVILCEGQNRKGFCICRSCGAHMAKPRSPHKSPSNSECRGTLERFSLGHELVTDVVRLQFPQLNKEWDAYSVAYAVLLGAAEALDVPNVDLDVTITKGDDSGEAAIVLYDNVPGGAGLVAQLERESIFKAMINNARKRVQGDCGCDSSCYGCLRSYRNQFAHPHLNRKRVLDILGAKV